MNVYIFYLLKLNEINLNELYNLISNVIKNERTFIFVLYLTFIINEQFSCSLNPSN